MANTKVVWAEPPEQQRRDTGGVKWTDFAAELRTQPGKWAIMTTRKQASYATNMAHNVKWGLLKAFKPAGAYDATTRRTSDTEVTVYVRYVGHEG